MSPLPACRRLVVGIDFSPAGAAALRLAAAWARPRRAPLHLLHATPELLPAEAEETLREALDLLAAGARAENQDLRCEAELRRSEEPGAMLREAASGEGTWLVLGAEGSAAQALRRVGRVAEDACRNATCPVLVAPPRWRGPRSGRKRAALAWQRVLVGLSGGERDRSRLEAALSLAHPERPAAVHVVDASWARCYPATARSLVDGPLRETSERWLARFLELEDELVDVAGSGPEIELHRLKQGPVHRDLAGLAESQASELLLVGSGPTAARAAGLVECPLLVLP